MTHELLIKWFDRGKKILSEHAYNTAEPRVNSRKKSSEIVKNKKIRSIYKRLF